MTDVPRSHPRYESLMTRARIERGVDAGLVARQGLSPRALFGLGRSGRVRGGFRVLRPSPCGVLAAARIRKALAESDEPMHGGSTP